jgi:DNA-binding response OmpR family regulator
MSQFLTNRRAQLDVIVVDPRPQDYSGLVEGSAGADVVFQFAASATDALRLRATGGDCLWLVNMKLPDSRGSDLLAALRGRNRRAVVYLVSDWYSPEEELEARMCGASMYLCKPADELWNSLCDVSPLRRLARCA